MAEQSVSPTHESDVGESDAIEVEDGATRKQVRREQIAGLVRSPGFIIGTAVLCFWILAALFPGLLTTWGPKETVLSEAGDRLTREPPGSNAWWGTDNLGRDVYTRTIFGARPIMIVAPVASFLAVVAGSLLGMLVGYYRGWVDEVLSRFVEAVLSIPAILMAILIVVTFGGSDAVIIGAIAVLFVPPVARTLRAATLAEAQLDYVTSAKMRGERGLFIIAREIFPNVIGVTVVELTIRLGYAIFTLATLSFLGIIGGNATDADWGVDVSSNYDQIIADIWWPTIFPALAIASLVISVNLIADSVEKATSS